ncbi:ABSCISIC ACID-INSENSITIVE 5-like protein 2 [Linum perenne]
MNLDELLKNVLTAEANQSVDAETEGTQLVNQTSLQRQASLSIAGALSKKTVDEVWRDIQQSKTNGEKKKDRQPTLGEMTLEDFLVKAGVHMGGGSVMDVAYPENTVAVAPIPPPQLMGTLSDSQMPARKRGAPGEIVEKHVERRQKRMIKNRESAARSRARKQAYTNELENKVSRLEEENERLRKLKVRHLFGKEFEKLEFVSGIF